MRQGIENLYHGLAGVEGVKVYAGNMSLQKTLDLVNRPGSSDTSDLSIALSGIYCLQELSGENGCPRRSLRSDGGLWPKSGASDPG
jgi:hypothetical protein